MTWVRLDESMPEHPKIADVSDRAFRLHISALCYANRLLTDGRIPDRIAQTLVPNGKRAAGELVAAGIWDRADSAYEIHDFLEYQPSRSQVEEQREQTRERVAKWRERREKHKSDGVTTRRRNTVSTHSPGPSRTEEVADDVADAPSSARRRDPIWDAFVSELGPAPETSSGRGAWNAAAKQLRDISIDPDLIHTAVAEHRHLWPNIDPVTPTSIAKHWTQLTASANGYLAGETRLARARRVNEEAGR